MNAKNPLNECKEIAKQLQDRSKLLMDCYYSVSSNGLTGESQVVYSFEFSEFDSKEYIIASLKYHKFNNCF